MHRNALITQLLLRGFVLALVLTSLAFGVRLSAGEPAFFAATTPVPGGCKTNEQCAKEEFCAKLFGRCSETGKCEARPADCIEHGGKVLIRPVCGCDGKDYDSVCLAAIAGVSVDHEGSCKP